MTVESVVNLKTLCLSADANTLIPNLRGGQWRQLVRERAEHSEKESRAQFKKRARLLTLNPGTSLDTVIAEADPKEWLEVKSQVLWAIRRHLHESLSQVPRLYFVEGRSQEFNLLLKITADDWDAFEKMPCNETKKSFVRYALMVAEEMNDSNSVFGEDEPGKVKEGWERNTFPVARLLTLFERMEGLIVCSSRNTTDAELSSPSTPRPLHGFLKYMAKAWDNPFMSGPPTRAGSTRITTSQPVSSAAAGTGPVGAN